MKMAVTDQIKILDRKIMKNEAQCDLDRKAAKISALSSNNLDKYEYLTGEDLNLKPSTVEQAKFEYSPLGRIFNKGLDKEDDKKEGLLKRLKNFETNQNRNNNDNDKSNLSSARSELSTKTLTNDDKTETSFEYLKDNTEEFFGGYPYIFDSDLKEFFNHITPEEEENIDYHLLLKQILLLSKKTFSFLQKYGDLYNFWYSLLLDSMSFDEFKLQQIKFLKDLMNGFEVYKKFKKPNNESNYKAENLYLILLGNPKKTVDDIFLKIPTDKYNEKIYLQAKILFNFTEEIFKKLSDKKIIIKSDPNQLNTEKYEEGIAERTKLRKQKLDKIKEKEQNINNKLFKHYFKYQSPSKMYNTFSDAKNAEEHNIQVNLIKSGLIDLKKDIENESKDDVNKIEETNKIVNIVEVILYFNNDDQQGQGLKNLTPNQMLSRLPITLAQLNAGNNSEKLKHEIRQILYSLYR